MEKSLSKIAKAYCIPIFTIALTVAITLTISCSSNDGDNGDTPSSDSNGVVISSSSGGGTSSSNEPISSSNTPIGGSSSSNKNVQSSSSNAPSGGSSSSSSVPSGDNIANYKTKQIGTQVWMAENLNYDVPGSKCNNNKESNCAIYGRLYDWATAMALPASCNSTSCSDDIKPKHQGICPQGWHIPSDEDWGVLIDFVGGTSIAGTKLKSETSWELYSGVPAGTDEFGFSALPGGFCHENGSFVQIGKQGYWLTASEFDSDYAYIRRMDYQYEYEYVYVFGNYNAGLKSNLFSVRCLQD